MTFNSVSFLSSCPLSNNSSGQLYAPQAEEEQPQPGQPGPINSLPPRPFNLILTYSYDSFPECSSVSKTWEKAIENIKPIGPINSLPQELLDSILIDSYDSLLHSWFPRYSIVSRTWKKAIENIKPILVKNGVMPINAVHPTEAIRTPFINAHASKLRTLNILNGQVRWKDKTIDIEPEEIENILKNCPLVETIRLQDCDLNGGIFKEIAQQKELSRLKLKSCDGITDQNLTLIGNHEKLASLTLYCGRHVSQTSITSFTNLTTLRLRTRDPITNIGAAITSLANLTILKLDLGRTPGKELSEIDMLTNLTSLSLV